MSILNFLLSLHNSNQHKTWRKKKRLTVKYSLSASAYRLFHHVIILIHVTFALLPYKSHFYGIMINKKVDPGGGGGRKRRYF